jgi:hypothetical protein
MIKDDQLALVLRVKIQFFSFDLFYKVFAKLQS